MRNIEEKILFSDLSFIKLQQEKEEICSFGTSRTFITHNFLNLFFLLFKSKKKFKKKVARLLNQSDFLN